MINAKISTIGGKYKTSSGILVEVLEKRSNSIVVKSDETGNKIAVPFDYPLLPLDSNPIQFNLIEENKVMSNETPTPTAQPAPTKTRKLKKSNVVDEGLKNNLSTDEIVKNVLAAFPEAPEKSIRNLVSVRRSKLSKTTV